MATAGKIAAIYYKMARYKEKFTPLDLAAYQEKHKIAKISYLERTLKRLKEEAAWGGCIEVSYNLGCVSCFNNSFLKC